jgi:hypothetical protein
LHYTDIFLPFLLEFKNIVDSIESNNVGRF